VERIAFCAPAIVKRARTKASATMRTPERSSKTRAMKNVATAVYSGVYDEAWVPDPEHRYISQCDVPYGPAAERRHQREHDDAEEVDAPPVQPERRRSKRP